MYSPNYTENYTENHAEIFHPTLFTALITSEDYYHIPYSSNYNWTFYTTLVTLHYLSL